MLFFLQTLLVAVRALLRPRAALVLENLALRQQLAVLKRTASRPRRRRLARVLGVERALAMLEPAAMIPRRPSGTERSGSPTPWIGTAGPTSAARSRRE